jgi:epoxyqueuosine reductase
MSHPAEELLNKIKEQGWKAGIVPIAHLEELKQAICDRYESGLLGPVFYRDRLNIFSFEPPEHLPDAQSIIIVALPVPQTRITFRWQGLRLGVILPPTYAGYSATTARVQAALACWLRAAGYAAAGARLPLKTLAARSGLAEYGRNNLCYVRGMGSFLQLAASFSDLPCPADPWREPVSLERCKSCSTCLRNCPTGAISWDRFLLRAEDCLTYHNESSTEFPDWIQPSWHHCLIGCMRCQSKCPENQAVWEWFDDRIEFSEQETAGFIEGVPWDQLPLETGTKLRCLGLNEDYPILCRNLSMIILARSGDGQNNNHEIHERSEFG